MLPELSMTKQRSTWEAHFGAEMKRKTSCQSMQWFGSILHLHNKVTANSLQEIQNQSWSLHKTVSPARHAPQSAKIAEALRLRQLSFVFSEISVQQRNFCPRVSGQKTMPQRLKLWLQILAHLLRCQFCVVSRRIFCRGDLRSAVSPNEETFYLSWNAQVMGWLQGK